MRITRIFLKRPTLVVVLIALTLIAAVMALQTLVVQQLPNSGLPAITVNASLPGASTTELETEVALPIEDQLAGTPYLDHIDTTIQNGTVSISASFTLQSTDTENIANVERALQAAQRQLPSTITAPTFRVANPSEPVVITLALVSPKYTQAVLAAVANNSIVPAIEQLPGVSNVNVAGTTQAAFMVTVNPNLLAADNLTLTDVINSITPNNERLPGGFVYQPTRETQLDIRGDLPNPQSVAALPIHVTYAGTTTTGSSGSAGTASTGSSGSAAASTGGSAGAAGASSGTTGTSGAGGTAVLPPQPSVSFPPLLGISQVPQSTTVSTSASPAPSASGLAAPAAGAAQSATSANAATTANTATTGGTSTGATTTGATTTGAATTGGTTTTGTTAGTTTTSGTATTATGTTSAASGTGGGGISSPTTSTVTTTSSSVGAGSSGIAQVSADQSASAQTITSTSASSTANTPAAPVSGSSPYGSGSGISTSPFIGALGTWAVPTADKKISDVAVVQDGTVIQRVYSSQNGRPGVTLFIQKQATASEVTVSNEILSELPSLRRQFPDIQFQLAHNQATFTEQQVASVQHTLIEGIFLTAIVMLFFLASWRNAVVVMIAIPTSLGVTLFVMKMLNLTLDTVSLMAMTLVIGILIDDSTVVLENIERHRSMGEAPPDAALNGRSEIGMAAIVITMVDVVVFLPIAFAGGQVGQLLTEFAIVIVIATLTSLFVSFTITPTLAGLWSMNSTWRPWAPIRWFDEKFTALRTRYHEVWLPWSFAHPWPLLIGAAVGCVLAFLLIPTGLIGEEYIPAGDQGTIFTQVTLPAGYPLSDTVQVMNRLEQVTKQVITAHDLEYETTIAGAYSAAFGGFVQEGNVGQISVYLNDDRTTSTDAYTTELQSRLQAAAPRSAVVTATAATQQGGGNQQEIDELVSTTNGADPTPYAARVFQTLRTTPGATGVQNSSTNAAPQMEVDFDRDALQALDVSDGTAAQAVEAAFGGAVASQIETPDRGLTQIEVIYPRQDQTSLADVLAIPVRSQSGNIVRLGDVANLKYSPAPLVITRENRADVVHVTANVAAGSNLADVTRQFQQRVRALHLPPTVTMRPAAQGQQDLMGQALRTLGTSLVISVIFVFLLIVSLYNSYRTPFVTLFAIPVATIGALGALWITHQTLNLYSLIGTILLVGLVTKNGILLVDYADTVRTRGASREEGILEAATIRFRPIVMTTIAMIAGMLPLALGLEPGGATRASLAIVVIGGLLSSLLLTLFLVPIMYRWIAPAQLAQETRFADEPPPPAPQTGPAHA